MVVPHAGRAPGVRILTRGQHQHQRDDDAAAAARIWTQRHHRHNMATCATGITRTPCNAVATMCYAFPHKMQCRAGSEGQ